ncbi:hypothetical protein FJZ18_01930 [Candidatus Pacearchaeota archaeon]|nr:hypothetical protein [Candidatus Pacearchaeota archaeon]
MVYTIGQFLSQWQQAGVFDYLLPFLLIFAVVLGILSTTNILGLNKGIHVIIALVIGMLALQLNFVPDFFREVFPRLGVALAVILVIMICIGLFIPDEEKRYWFWGLGAIGFVAALVVLSQSFSSFGWYSSLAYDDYVGWIVGVVLIIGVIIAIASSGSHTGGNHDGRVTLRSLRE